jgi:major membrane immunogen (membrane-anchored lipoprotein)
MLRRLTLLAALAAALGLAACGEKTLDTGDAEDKIADGVQEQQNYEPENVECPDDMEAKKGNTYECTVTAPDGKEAKAEIEMLDDEGRFRFEVPPPQ